MSTIPIEYRARVKQFTDSDSPSVVAMHHGTCGNLVNLTQNADSLSFHFSMTPALRERLGETK